MPVKDLIDLVHIKGSTIECPSEMDWSTLESRGLKFPSEYKAYLRAFGTGVLADFFIVWNPFSKIDAANWFSGSEQGLKAFLECYPEYTDLLPFGHTANGDTLFWKVGEDVEQWTVAVARAAPVLYTNAALSDFLMTALTSHLYEKKLPDLTCVSRSFTPFTA